MRIKYHRGQLSYSGLVEKGTKKTCLFISQDERERERERQTDRERERDRQTDRQTETEMDIYRNRETLTGK